MSECMALRAAALRAAALIVMLIPCVLTACGGSTRSAGLMLGDDSAANVAAAAVKDLQLGESKADFDTQASNQQATDEQIIRWAVPEFKALRLLACYDCYDDAPVSGLAITPDGKRFAVAGNRLTLWDLNRSQPMMDLLAAEKSTVTPPLQCMAISPDGNWIAAGDNDGRLHMWRLSEQHKILDFTAHHGRLTKIAFSPDSELFATTNSIGELRVWRTENGQQLGNWRVGTGKVGNIRFLSSNQLAVVGGETSIWDIEAGERQRILSSGYVSGSGLALSRDCRWLAFSNAEGIEGWDVLKSTPVDVKLRGHAGAVTLAEFSHDGRWIATYGIDSTVRIWAAASGRAVQVMDADGSPIVELKWLPQGALLLALSANGLVRLWGTAEAADAIGVEKLALPGVEPMAEDPRTPATWLQLQQVIDLRVFPRLPGAVPRFSLPTTANYTAEGSLEEACLFYRTFLGRDGWTEVTHGDSLRPGLMFEKQGCVLNVSGRASAIAGGSRTDYVRVNLVFTGNVDLDWLPRYTTVEESSDYRLLFTSGYRTRANITNVEVALLKKFRAAGWTAYSPLTVAGQEEVGSRKLRFLQGASQVTTSIRVAPGDPELLSVENTLTFDSKSVPVPADVGWMEYDVSNGLRLVAVTKLSLDAARDFYDCRMAAESWMARPSGRRVEQARARLPYMRGQQDVVVRLQTASNGTTLVLVGDVEQQSWQLQALANPYPELNTIGLQAADFPLPTGAELVEFDAAREKLKFCLANVTPKTLEAQYRRKLETLGWKPHIASVSLSEFVSTSFVKDQAQIDLLLQQKDGPHTSVVVEGNGLLWTKSLPEETEEVAYETWLRRHGRIASLDYLDRFLAEMQSIEAK